MIIDFDTLKIYVPEFERNDYGKTVGLKLPDGSRICYHDTYSEAMQCGDR
jgi:hypothetical protein